MSARTLQESVERLVEPRPGFKPLDPAAPVGARPGEVAVGRPGSGTGQGDGEMSFSEADYAQRTRYPARVVWSSDGIFAFEWRPPRRFIGSAGNIIELREPPP